MLIRNISNQDQEQINKLYQQLYPEESNTEVDLSSESFKAKYLPFCIEDNNEVLGFIIGTIVKFGVQKYGYIEDLVVREDTRHQGLGSQLLEYLINQFKTECVKQILVSIDVNNEHNLIDFYKKFGFEECKNPSLCKSL